MVPGQSLVHRQLPWAPLAQTALVQHLTFAPSQGQAPSMVMPPLRSRRK